MNTVLLYISAVLLAPFAMATSEQSRLVEVGTADCSYAFQKRVKEGQPFETTHFQKFSFTLSQWQCAPGDMSCADGINGPAGQLDMPIRIPSENVDLVVSGQLVETGDAAVTLKLVRPQELSSVSTVIMLGKLQFVNNFLQLGHTRHWGRCVYSIDR